MNNNLKALNPGKKKRRIERNLSNEIKKPNTIQ
jgi:hypothetical protein